MNKKNKIRQYLFLAVLAIISCSCGTKTVSSLEELLPYLQQDDVTVKLVPGTYSISAADVENGTYGSETIQDKYKTILLFEGSNSTYDFTGVTIKFNTDLLRAFGNIRVNELQVIGNNNVLKNLTMVDDGSVYDHPTKGALGICIDGKNNLVEGFHQTVKGSYPYGYGDSFGKGKRNVIRHLKHSALLVRGYKNHVKNCTIIHRSYGHALFMQAASYPTIEGCYIEGEVRTTDDMLAEAGTGSPADEVNFETIWGYKLPAGYMMSLNEAGIRAYNAGETIIDGKEIKRGTDNPTVINCTMKNTRTGVTLAHATGKKHVEGCKAIGCENGFSLASGTLINCSADCIYGPVYSSTYGNDKSYNADITILPASAPYYNGSGNVAYIGGSKHQITLRGGEDALEAGLKIKVGGEKNNIRLLNGNFPKQNNFVGSDFDLNNQTKFPVELTDKSKDVRVTSLGEVTDLGTNNIINKQ